VVFVAAAFETASGARAFEVVFVAAAFETASGARAFGAVPVGSLRVRMHRERAGRR
jgi:hypothetical protein